MSARARGADRQAGFGSRRSPVWVDGLRTRAGATRSNQRSEREKRGGRLHALGRALIDDAVGCIVASPDKSAVSPFRRSSMKSFALILSALVTAGCSTYAPLPLDAAASLSTAATLRDGAPLTVAQVATLALERNPDLVAQRRKSGVARAQLIEAGLLPNPSLAGAFLPLLSGVGVAPAWSFGLSQDLQALVLRPSRRRAAQDGLQQVNADLLWREWQTAGRARQLATELILGRSALERLESADRLLAQRSAAMQEALAAADVTLVTAAPSASAYQSAHADLLAAQEQQQRLRHGLNALLGVAPDVELPLAAHVDLPPFDPSAARAAAVSLGERRPDLVALRFGYAAADENLRAQILSQFPDVAIGVSATRDSSRVLNVGPQATIDLPIFDRNQGGVAVARATRAQLHAEYGSRLAASEGEVRALLAEHALLEAHLAAVRADLPEARRGAERAAQAFGRSALDERSYIELMTTLFAKERELTQLTVALADGEIAIDTLIGAGLPPLRIDGATR